MVAVEHVLRELERRRDPRAGPERVRPRADDLAGAGRGEQPDDRAQLTRRRPRRQQLVRHVREDDDADGRIRVDERLERAADDAGLVVQDREREVEDDDAGRARSGAVRGRAGSSWRALSTAAASRTIAPPPKSTRSASVRSPAERNEAVSCVSIAGRLLSPSMCLLQSPPALLFLAQALLLELAQLFLERRAHAAGEALRLVGPRSRRRPRERAGRLREPVLLPALGEHLGDELERAALVGSRRWRARRPRAARAPARAASAAAPARVPAPAPARRGAAASRRRPARRPPPGAGGCRRSGAPAAAPATARYDGSGTLVTSSRHGFALASSSGRILVCTVRTGNGARSAPRPPARFWNSTRAGSNSKGSVSRSGTQGCLRQRSTYVIRMCELDAGIGARHRRRPDAAPRLEADPHPDAARIDMAQVDCEVDLRAHGVAEDDDPVGERRPRPQRAGSSTRRRRRRGEERRPGPQLRARRGRALRPPLRAGRSRYATTPRRARRNSFQSRKAPSTSEGSLDESSTGSRSSSGQLLQQRQQPLLVGAPPRGRLLLRQAHVRDPAAARVAERDDDPADVGKALLPDRILDHNRYDVPEVLDGCQPRLARGRVEKVREDEDEAPGGDVAAMLEEVLERALDPVGRRAPAGLVAPVPRAGRRAGARPAAAARTARRPRSRGSRRSRRPGRRSRRRCRSRAASPRPCRARAAAPRRRRARRCGRRRRRRAAPRRRSARGRRTRRRRARTTSGPRRPSRSCGCRRPAGTAASPPPRCRGRAERSASCRASARSAGGGR